MDCITSMSDEQPELSHSDSDHFEPITDERDTACGESKATEVCLCPLDGSDGRHFRGRRGRCLADTDLTMVERLGAARNADS